MSQTHSPPASTHDSYYDLGSYHRRITSSSQDAQVWFDRGLIWTYAFNHEEAAKCFEHAITIDSSCAMAYWGLAYSTGPNYNKPWEVFDEDEIVTSVNRTHRAVMQAKEHAANASPVERALVDALQFRYPKEWPAKDFSMWNQQYAEAMESVYKEFQDDLDVATLYSDALMNLTPWQLWDLRSGKPAAGARTMEAKAVLDRALATEEGLKHPGLLHLFIHLMEMSGTPERALTVADHLRGLVPDSGHLNHMPTHLDILCGDYRRAIASNSDAIRVDEKFLAQEGPLNFYTLYRSHDYHFRIYAAMFSGQFKIALETVEQLERSIPEGLLRVKSPPMADWLEGFLSTRIHVLVRFGRWQDLVDLELPNDQDLYCVTTAMVHYGKGVAFSAMNKMTEAEEQRNLFEKSLKRVPSSRTLFNNTCTDILNIAAAMLSGEMAYRVGKDFDLAFNQLERAIYLDDNLPYDEPWGWMQPTRHAHGALLLEQGRVEEAVKVYAADLGFVDTLPRALRHPNNVWALHGYYECLVRLGRMAEARIVEPQLRIAEAVADVPIKASCFCRLKTAT
ncbi:TPR domain protein [Mollisia scopiformis]|uniref:TPR domain protein n=1 Tax=Mollisia scopiformis TaxID=149040 RepID=A0A194XN67_MOLSC|nr:TPR domain protein [Mollisia scopiformis]KUJ21695.1 TPR domain protein [Mollisia scopiformis]